MHGLKVSSDTSFRVVPWTTITRHQDWLLTAIWSILHSPVLDYTTKKGCGFLRDQKEIERHKYNKRNRSGGTRIISHIYVFSFFRGMIHWLKIPTKKKLFPIRGIKSWRQEADNCFGTYWSMWIAALENWSSIGTSIRAWRSPQKSWVPHTERGDRDRGHRLNCITRLFSIGHSRIGLPLYLRPWSSVLGPT